MNKFSKYLKKRKVLVHKLGDLLGLKYPFVSILATDVKGKTYGVDRRSINIRPSSICECGFVCRVYNEGVYAIPETLNFHSLIYRKDILQKAHFLQNISA